MPWIWNHFPFGKNKRIRMALSQVALNVFYLFNGRKILCCPQTQTTHSSVTAARGHFQQWGCECIHICPSICSHAPYGIWGSCCMAMSVQRLQCAAGGWASLGFQLPAAPRSFWAVVARRGQSSVPGHSLERFMLSESKANGIWILWGRDSVDTILQRLSPSLFYVCSIPCVFVLPRY